MMSLMLFALIVTLGHVFLSLRFIADGCIGESRIRIIAALWLKHIQP